MTLIRLQIELLKTIAAKSRPRASSYDREDAEDLAVLARVLLDQDKRIGDLERKIEEMEE